MMELKIRVTSEKEEYYVSTCTHINGYEEVDICSELRNEWLKKKYDKGLKIKVARGISVNGEEIYWGYEAPKRE